MRKRLLILAGLLILALGAALVAAAKTGSSDKGKDSTNAATPAASTAQDDPMRLEGERAYHANCGRCHMAPPKFAPRTMATIIRHMRVRAAITDQEMRSILHYMSQ